MAYFLPQFNLTANVYTWVAPFTPLGAPRVTIACNLSWGRRSQTASTGGTGDPEGFSACMTLLAPLGSDLRGYACYGDFGKADVVECPAGSGKLYKAIVVDDVGKGFPNEHRAAMLLPTFFYGNWPTPIP